MMVATENNPGLHVEALADIATLVEAPGFCRRLRHARSPKEVLAIIVAEAKARMSE
jgi:mannitol/fructose-specific phosphotransferase system IIA component (Ntr-type)